MKKKIKTVLFISVLLLIFSGCLGPDKNDFLQVGKHTLISIDMKVNGSIIPDVDTISVNRFFDNTKKSVIVEAGDLIEISLNSNFENGFDAVYKWEIFEKSIIPDVVTGEYPPVIFLSDSKDLRFNISGAPAEHIIRCIITDKNNNNENSLYFSITINKPSGYAVVYESDKGGDFDFFKSPSNTIGQEEPVFYRNIFSSANGSFIENPKTLGVNASTLILFSNNNVMSLNANTYKVVSAETGDFFLLFPPEFSQADFYNSAGYAYAILDNEIYFSGSGFKFKSSITPGENYHSEIIVNEGMRNSNSLWVFFDKTDKAFRYGNFNGSVNTFVSDGTTLFDINDTKMDLLYAETGNNNYINAIMKDVSNKYYFCELDLKYEGTGETQQRTVKALRKSDISDLDGFSPSSKWAMHTRAPFSFYSDGNAIYRYNQEANSSTQLLTVEGEVTLMEVFRNVDEAINSKTLYIATYHSGKGYLYEVEYDILSGSLSGEPNRYEFEGRIVELKYFQ